LARRHALPAGPFHAPVLCGNVWCSSRAGPCVTAHSGLGSGWWPYMQWNDLRISQCVGIRDPLVVGLWSSVQPLSRAWGMILILPHWYFSCSVSNLLQVIHLTPRMLSWLLDFWENCAPLCNRILYMPGKEHPQCNEHKAGRNSKLIWRKQWWEWKS
jgi:hypothetical protein